MNSNTFNPTSEHNIELLRDVVQWANAQREDYWHPANGKSMPWHKVIGVYLAVKAIGTTIEEIVGDRPADWPTYDSDERAAVNYVRRALGVPAHR